MLPFLLFLASIPPAPAPRWCSAPAMAAWPMQSLKQVLDDGGPAVAEMYALPSVPSDSVIRVTDEAVCERAARAYYRHVLGPFPAGGVAVVRVGDRYAVYGSVRAGEWTILSIFTDRFELITNIAM